jgi:hypothetical protein
VVNEVGKLRYAKVFRAIAMRLVEHAMSMYHRAEDKRKAFLADNPTIEDTTYDDKQASLIKMQFLNALAKHFGVTPQNLVCKESTLKEVAQVVESALGIPVGTKEALVADMVDRWSRGLVQQVNTFKASVRIYISLPKRQMSQWIQ